MKEEWFVDIAESIPEEPHFRIEKTLGPYGSESLALKAERGVFRNLDTERFWTMVRAKAANGEQRVGQSSMKRIKDDIRKISKRTPPK